jgi:hypothetical protein
VNARGQYGDRVGAAIAEGSPLLFPLHDAPLTEFRAQATRVAEHEASLPPTRAVILVTLSDAVAAASSFDSVEAADAFMIGQTDGWRRFCMRPSYVALFEKGPNRLLLEWDWRQPIPSQWISTPAPFWKRAIGPIAVLGAIGTAGYFFFGRPAMKDFERARKAFQANRARR